MKKYLLTLLIALGGMSMSAQITKETLPTISVSGTAKVNVVPDEVSIYLGVQSIGNDAKDVKQKNDQITDKVVKAIRRFGIESKDFQTKNVSLNRNYQSDKKKYNYVANQTLIIKLRDLSQYDALIMTLTDEGLNTINSVEFSSSKYQMHKAEARVLAIENALKIANDYVSPLKQTVGKAISISEVPSYHAPVFRTNMAMMEKASMDVAYETIAPGEIEVQETVQVIFELK